MMKNKILKNLKLGLAGIVLAGSFNGCAIYNIQHEIKLKKYPSLSTEQKDSLFKDLNPGLKEGLKKVYVINDKEYKFDASHTHKNGTICFLDIYDSEDVFHEIAHTKHFALNKIGSDFSKKWEQVADFKYGRKNIQQIHLKNGYLLRVSWRDGTDEPKNGMLRPYSATDIYEDVATFVQALGYIDEEKFVKKGDSLYVLNEKLFPLFFADTTDNRYQKKLNLLKKYNFLTKEEHEKLSENLGSLNYLLKK